MITKEDLIQALKELDEKIAIRLNKYFYTKGEIDAKFDKIDAKFDKIDAKFDKIDAKFDEIDEKFKEQMHQTKMLFEDLKANNLEMLHEKDDMQDEKLENHEGRIEKLETTF